MAYQVKEIRFDAKQVTIILEDNIQQESQELKLHAEVYIRNPLIQGQRLDVARYADYLDANHSYEVEQYALKLIAKRDISQSMFSTKMIKKYPSSIKQINEIMENYRTRDWLNDQRYGHDVVAKELRQLHGEQRIRLALHNAGFNEEESETYLPDNLEILCFKNAFELAKKKLKGKSLTDEKTKRSIIYRLQAKGHSTATIFSVIRAISQNTADELDY